MENKKSTVLLTVIAVATLLVAVVGATFAYFSAQSAENVQRNVVVTSNTAASTTFALSDDDLILSVDQAGMPNETTTSPHSNTITATINHRAGAGSETYCYQLSIANISNNFTYSSNGAGYEGAGTTEPELVLEVKDGGTSGVVTGTALTATASNTADLDGANANVTFVSTSNSNLSAATLKTDLLNSNDLSGKTLYDLTTKSSDQIIGKFTITEDATAGKAYVHVITLDLYYVNYKWDQSLMSNPNNNARKDFTGLVKLDAVSCS